MERTSFHNQTYVGIGPGCYSIKDKDGELPLHGVTYNNNVDAIKLLVDAYPDAVLEKNNKGEIPLHCAAESIMINLLFFFFIEALKTFSNNSTFSPLLNHEFEYKVKFSFFQEISYLYPVILL